MPQPTVNRHGLPRKVPPGKKQQLREACGFGCVICGDGFCDDAHLDPPYEDATVHDISKMALLCKYHHPDTDIGDLPLQAVIKARKNPICKSRGFTEKHFYMEAPLCVKFGSNVFNDVRCIVKTGDGDEWFVINPSDSGSIFPGISAKFFGNKDKIDFEIEENEILVNSVYKNRWTLGTHVWDASLKGRTAGKGTTLEIRKGPRQITLRINFEPPHTVNIVRLEMKLHCSGVLIDSKGALTISHNGTSRKFVDNYISHQDSVIIIPSGIEPVKAGAKLYDYFCDKCGSDHERRVRYEDRFEEVPCLVCRGNPGMLQYRLSPPMISSDKKMSTPPDRLESAPHSQSDDLNYFINNRFKGYDPAEIMSMPNTIYSGNSFH